MLKQERNYELTLRTFVGNINLSMGNSPALIFGTSVSDILQNTQQQSTKILHHYTILAHEQIIIARVWSTMSAMKTILDLINFLLKGRYSKGLSFSGLDHS